ncbi:branched-chain amino acid transport system permease protein [Spinactinospora alkalitolerans]|uniref:Branched-chain amino acid transport system permease protein n=1 Tax=Spinactinospora alkalitolerans TaxID=687207 RepID=A0A852TVX9_9ACTN|nr:branched-chain amino acid ABC transporter permease [Spinactinospora alkalitolerans]NYE48088.1 branched-chain amino acid transport system permease protein [Spinactinospora alkalitolerans]
MSESSVSHPAPPESAVRAAAGGAGGGPGRPSWYRRPGGYLTAAAAVVLLAIPFYVEVFWLQAGLFAMAAAIGAIGLNLLTGATGQLSLGHAFFIAVGAYGYVAMAAEPAGGGGELLGLGLPTPVAMVGAVLLAGLAGLAFSPIAGRVSGIYLGIASIALVFIGQHLLFNAASVTGGFNGRIVPEFTLLGLSFADTPELVLAGVPFGALERLWYLGLALAAGSALFARGVLRGRPGRAMNTIRDHPTAAAVIGIPVARYRAGVFVLSSMYAGLSGVLLALVFQQTVPDYFDLFLSLDYLAMIVIGGLGSVGGAVLGGVFVALLPQVLTRYADSLPLVVAAGTGDGLAPAEAARILYGAAVVAVVLFIPGGLLPLWQRCRDAVARPRPNSAPPPSDDKEKTR